MKDKITLLKDRLNDLSRRNRSIRMLKVYDKWSFDISELNKVDKDSMEILKATIKKQKKLLVKQDVDKEESLVYVAPPSRHPFSIIVSGFSIT